ncbi:MAG: DNA-3-methyladenine glycosylase 2 family protein [Chitinophagales bacterium]|nr:DNA-3-methyladenine glycosylase 2 family protein [Chitinophagales bacterium]
MHKSVALAHLSKESAISPIINTVELPELNPSGQVYYDLLQSIVSQQLSIKAADTIFNRFCALFPENYPDSKLLIELDNLQLRNAGLSFQKASYLKNIAAFNNQTALDKVNWNNMPDEDIIRMLTQIKGVGTWTVQMLLLFTFVRPDVFPIDDLGIQQGMKKLFKLESEGKQLKQQMLEYAEPWQPWRSYASRLLWRWKDTKAA